MIKVSKVLPLAMKNSLLGTVVGYDTGSDKIMGLTFDDGPNPVYTLPLLDVLDAYNARATFFLLGKHVVQFPEAAREIVKRGHAIGNHTYHHKNLAKSKSRAIVRDIHQGQKAIYRATGVQPHLFRPPHGLLDSNAFFIARSMGFRPILWSICPRDWIKAAPQQIAQHIVNRHSPGAIVLLHDGSRDLADQQGSDRSHTVVAVQELLQVLTGQGYQFMNLTQLAGKFSERRIDFRHVLKGIGDCNSQDLTLQQSNLVLSRKGEST